MEVCLVKEYNKGGSKTTLTSFLAFLDHLPPYVDIFYLINVQKKSTFLNYLPILYPLFNIVAFQSAFNEFYMTFERKKKFNL